MSRFGFLFGALLSLSSTFAFAHWADLAVAEINVDGAEVTVTLTLPTGLVADFDNDGSGQLSPQEVRRHRRALEAYFTEGFVVTGDAGQRAAARLEPDAVELPLELGLAPGSHSTLELRYRFARPVRGVNLDYRLFLPGVSTASCFVTVLRNDATETFVLTPEQRVLSFGAARVSWWHQAGGFLLLGVQHIWSGYDHLLFLLTLLMLGGGLGYLLKVVSAFTLAHSVTLSLAVLGLVSLPSRLVESGVALSIAYVAAENLFRDRLRAARWRWLLTFAFGLVHGLGFAAVLQAITLPRSGLATALLSFNLGVELGQILVVGLVAAALGLIRRWRHTPTLRWAVSASALVVGLLWFVERAFAG